MKNVSKREIIIGSVAVIVGLGFGYMGGAERERGRDAREHMFENEHGDMMMADGTRATSMRHGNDDMEDMMEGMLRNMRGKKGDALDKVFLDDMIAHHAGAVEMAALLKKGTTRKELLDFADAIINVQSQEIEQMREWRSTWFVPEKI